MAYPFCATGQARADQGPVGRRIDRPGGAGAVAAPGPRRRCRAARVGSPTSCSWAWVPPLANYASVLRAVHRIADPVPDGLGISRRS